MFSEPRAAPRLPPYLPSAAGTAHHLLRALTDPPGSQPARQSSRGIRYPPARRLSGTPGFLSFPNFPPPSFFFLLALCLSLQVSLYCTDTLFAKPYTLPRQTLPRPGPRRGASGGKGRGGEGQRWGRLAVAPAVRVQRGGGRGGRGGWGSPAEALCKLNKSSDLPCRSGLSCSVV